MCARAGLTGAGGAYDPSVDGQDGGDRLAFGQHVIFWPAAVRIRLASPRAALVECKGGQSSCLAAHSMDNQGRSSKVTAKAVGGSSDGAGATGVLISIPTTAAAAAIVDVRHELGKLAGEGGWREDARRLALLPFTIWQDVGFTCSLGDGELGGMQPWMRAWSSVWRSTARMRPAGGPRDRFPLCALLAR